MGKIGVNVTEFFFSPEIFCKGSMWIGCNEKVLIAPCSAPPGVLREDLSLLMSGHALEENVKCLSNPSQVRKI